MALINIAAQEIHCKIVYYGIGYCGKTTNLQYVHRSINPSARGEMLSIATETERTLFFDFLPLDLGTVHVSARAFTSIRCRDRSSTSARAWRSSMGPMGLSLWLIRKRKNLKRTSRALPNWG